MSHAPSHATSHATLTPRRLVLAAGTACLLAFAGSGAAFAATVPLKATLNGASEVPPTQSPGTGTMTGSLNTTTRQLTYTVTYSGLTGPATAAHFHGPAAAGANAGVMVPIKVAPDTMKGSAKLTAAQVKEVMDGMVYVNIHTAQNPGGEIRGQVTH